MHHRVIWLPVQGEGVRWPLLSEAFQGKVLKSVSTPADIVQRDREQHALHTHDWWYRLQQQHETEDLMFYFARVLVCIYCFDKCPIARFGFSIFSRYYRFLNNLEYISRRKGKATTHYSEITLR